MTVSFRVARNPETGTKLPYLLSVPVPGDPLILKARESAAVERKSLDDFATSAVDASLSFVMAELASLPRAAVVVEGRYGDVFTREHIQPGFLGDLVAQLQVRYPSVSIVFAGSRKLAEEYTFRFLGAARAELTGAPADRGPQPDDPR